MQCPNCGAQIRFYVHFCDECGTQVNPPSDKAQALKNGRIGYSLKIHDTLFTTYKRKSAIWAFLFASFLAAASIIGFQVYSAATGELEWPY